MVRMKKQAIIGTIESFFLFFVTHSLPSKLDHNFNCKNFVFALGTAPHNVQSATIVQEYAIRFDEDGSIAKIKELQQKELR